MKLKPSRVLLALSGAFLALAIIFYAVASAYLALSFTRESFRLPPDRTWQSFTGGFPLSSEQQIIELSFVLHLPAFHGRLYQIIADDCMESLSINNHSVEEGVIPFCGFAHGRTVDLSAFLRTGENLISARVKNSGGPASLSLELAWRDPLLLTLHIAGFLLLVCAALWLTIFLRLRPLTRALFALFCIGVLLRCAYLIATPIPIRAHDVGGHIDYLLTVARTLSLPVAQEGWESYQPPLYYVLTGLWARFAQALGRPLPVILREIQWFGCFASIITLAGFAWIASLLYPGKGGEGKRLLFFAALAFVPSAVFLAGRINNDTFLLLLLTFSFGFLLRWWRGKHRADWTIGILLLALAILTKSNALLLVPVAFGLLILKRGITRRVRIGIGVVAFLLLASLTVWNFALRSGADPGGSLVPNVRSLPVSLMVSNTPQAFLSFHPLRFVRQPFNDPWEDTAGRQSFWEYFIKSAFFGEFDFGDTLRPLASMMLLCVLLLLPVFLIGCWQTLRHGGERELPMWFLGVVLLLGHILYRLAVPYSTSQDFRYSLLLILPAAFLTLRGIDALRPFFLRAMGTAALLFLGFLEFTFLIAIIWLS